MSNTNSEFTEEYFYNQETSSPFGITDTQSFQIIREEGEDLGGMLKSVPPPIEENFPIGDPFSSLLLLAASYVFLVYLKFRKRRVTE